MPGRKHSRIWDRCVMKVKRKHSGNAYAICTAALGRKSFARRRR